MPSLKYFDFVIIIYSFQVFSDHKNFKSTTGTKIESRFFLRLFLASSRIFWTDELTFSDFGAIEGLRWMFENETDLWMRFWVGMSELDLRIDFFWLSDGRVNWDFWWAFADGFNFFWTGSANCDFRDFPRFLDVIWGSISGFISSSARTARLESYGFRVRCPNSSQIDSTLGILFKSSDWRSNDRIDSHLAISTLFWSNLPASIDGSTKYLISSTVLIALWISDNFISTSFESSKNFSVSLLTFLMTSLIVGFLGTS